MINVEEILNIIAKQGLSKNHMHLIYMTNGDYKNYSKKIFENINAFKYEAPYRIDDYNKLNEWIQNWW